MTTHNEQDDAQNTFARRSWSREMKSITDFKTSVKRNYYQITLENIFTKYNIHGSLKYVRINPDNILEIITEQPLDENTEQQEGKT